MNIYQTIKSQGEALQVFGAEYAKKTSRFRSKATRSFQAVFAVSKKFLSEVPFLLLRFLWACKENEGKTIKNR